MPTIPNIWQRFTGRTKDNTLDIVPQRFLRVFLDHGVEASQIPRLFPQIKLDDLKFSEKLLAALTPELLDQTAQFFGIRCQWLEGVDDEIYEYRHCYKHPELLLEHVASLNINPENPLQFPLRVLTTTKHLDCNDPRQQLLAPVLVEKIAELGDEWIYRYHIYRDGFNWSYAPTRIELKAITRLVCNAFHTVAPLFIVSNSEMENILEGKLIPRKYLSGCQVTSPSLEDYALSSEESVPAKETEELPVVLRYIEQHNLQNFSFSRPVDMQPSVESSQSQADSSMPPEAQETPKSGKRAQAKAVIWEPVRNAAKVLWAQNDQLTIADVIYRITKMPHLKASSLSESAIRKHIANLAPPGIAGKPGRKPKKSA